MQQRPVFVFALLLMFDGSHAFRNQVEVDEEDHPRHAFFSSTIARVAKRGTQWGDHVSPGTSHHHTKKASSQYISELHKRIQSLQSKGETLVTSDEIRRDIELLEDTLGGSFVNEVLTYIVAGVAATSFFEAFTVAIYFATFACSVGALLSAIFDEDESQYDSIEDLVEESDMSHAIDSSSVDACSLYEEVEDDAVVVDGGQHWEANPETQGRNIDQETEEELQRCYAGAQNDQSFLNQASLDTCIVHGSSSGESADEGAIDTIVQHETDATAEEPATKVNVIWHDSLLVAIDAHYFTTATKEQKDQTKPISLPRKKMLRPTTHETQTSEIKEVESTPRYVELSESEKDGAMLLSKSLGAASCTFGFVANALRFSGETVAATVGQSARIVGGTTKAVGWAVDEIADIVDRDPGQTSKKSLSKRRVAAKTIRLVAGALDSVSDSLILAGRAGENVAFAAASVAEGSVRILENAASTASDHLYDLGSASDSAAEVEDEQDSESRLVNHSVMPPTVQDLQTIDLEYSRNDEESRKEDTFGELVSHFPQWFGEMITHLTTETARLHSQAPEFFILVSSLYISSLLLLSRRNKTKSRGVEISFHSGNARCKQDNFADTDSTLTIGSAIKTEFGTVPDDQNGRSLAQRATDSVFTVLFVPLRVCVVILQSISRLAFNASFLLLLVHLVGWVFISRFSQYKSSVIERKSRFRGMQQAVEELPRHRATESTMWLNSLIGQIWSPTIRSKEGGLEMLISARLSSLIRQSLINATTISYVELESVRLGEAAPLLSNVQVLAVLDEQLVLQCELALDFEGAEILFRVKPSALEYKSLPSSFFSLNSFAAEFSLVLTLHTDLPEYPYVSTLDLSLKHVPELDFIVQPSLIPVLSGWIQSSISSSLSDYLEPNFLGIEIPAWLNGTEDYITYGTSSWGDEHE